MTELPTGEVLYTQEKYQPGAELGFYFSRPGLTIPGDWAPVTGGHLCDFGTVARVADEFIQVLSIRVLDAPANYALLGTDPVVDLFEHIKTFHPLRATDDINLFVGHSRQWPGQIYMRFPHAPSELAPCHSATELDDFLEPLGMGFEDSESYPHLSLVGGEWPVAYMRRVNQAEFRRAYDRLVLLTDWVNQAGDKMYRLLERFLRAQIRQIESRTAADAAAKRHGIEKRRYSLQFRKEMLEKEKLEAKK